MSVLIIYGSSNDSDIVLKLEKELDNKKINYKSKILSSHRNTQDLLDYLSIINKDNNIKIIIAIAGLSAALPGIIAANTYKIVIGLPISKNILNGMDSLISMMQNPAQAPVLTLGIDNYINAAQACDRILKSIK